MVPGIDQVRGYDLSVMTLVEGTSGDVVIDPLISRRPPMLPSLYAEQRAPRPVSAMVYTHSHVDHFGCVKAVLTEEDVTSGRVSVVAPEGS